MTSVRWRSVYLELSSESLIDRHMLVSAVRFVNEGVDVTEQEYSRA